MKDLFDVFLEVIVGIIISIVVLWIVWFFLLSIVEGRFMFDFEIERRGLTTIYIVAQIIVMAFIFDVLNLERNGN